MRLSYRVQIIFAAGLLVATYGVAQIWSLTAAFRGGSAGVADILAGTFGLLLLAASGLVVGRILYHSARAAESIKSQNQEALDDASNDNNSA